MTKQHFIALADAIKQAQRSSYLFAPFSQEQIKVLADFCKAQNPRFNRARWLAYINGECGPNGGARHA